MFGLNTSMSGWAFTAVLCVCLAVPTAGQAQPLTARTLDPIVQPGDKVVVQVNIGTKTNKVPKLFSVEFQLTYDTDLLSFQSAQAGVLFSSEVSGGQGRGFAFDRPNSGFVGYAVTLFRGQPNKTDVFGEVAHLQFTVEKSATLGTSSFSLQNASRGTASASVAISSSNLNGDDVEVAEDRRGERVTVPADAAGQPGKEVSFGKNGLLSLDFSSLGAKADLLLTRNGNPLTGTSLPSASGTPRERATNNFWNVSQAGSASFEADVCFNLSDLAVTNYDPAQLSVYRRADPSSSWSAVSTALRPNATTPTEICATGLSDFSQFTVTALQGHSRTITGTDGQGNDTGWRLLGLPAGAARSTLEEDLSFEVDSGSLLHTWAGGGPGAWSAVTSGSTQLPRGNGFILYFFDDSVDPLSSSGISLDLPATSEEQTANVTVDGLSQSNRFHLLGNPYDVAFDLGSFAGGDLPSKGFQNTVQIWDPAIPGWTTVTQGGSDNVAAWQGFFIERQSTGSGNESLTFDASGRQSGGGDLIGSKAGAAGSGDGETLSALVELGLTVTNETDTLGGDVAKVLFIEGAKPGWDAYEASQLPPPNSSSYATLSSPIEREGDLVQRLQASRAYPTTTDSITVPLSVEAAQVSGTAHLRWPEEKRGEWPEDWAVELEDTETGSRVDLREGSYGFDLSAGDGASLSGSAEARFRLHVVPGSSIPVELVGFSAQATGEGAARLTWQTASETGNAGFYVQRKQVQKAPGGTRWQDLGFVESKASGGTTSEPNRYRFRDKDLPYAADSLAYRLRQVDTDGTAHLTEAVTVALGAPGEAELRPPFPNPAARQATLRFGVPEPTAVRVSVYDLLGRRVATVTEGQREAGRYEVALPVASLSPGPYFVRLRAAGITRTRRLTVVH